MLICEGRRMNKTHNLKIRKDFADAVFGGEKTFEIRLNDRGFQKGDTIIFDVRDELMIPCIHPLNSIPYEITYVLNGWGLENGYVALAIKPVANKQN